MVAILNMDSILIDIDIKRKEEALLNISEVAKGLGICENEEMIYKELLNRENECSTSVGLGIAIPHIKSDYINKVTLVIIKPKKEFYWEKDEEVNVIISILAPKEVDSNLHIKLLSNLSRKLVNNDYKNLLSNSKDKDTIYNLIESALCS